MRFLGSIIVAGGVLLASTALAATVSVIPADGTPKETVFINRGAGFQPIIGATEGRSGDSVMALKTGVAAIVYPDGCKVAVSATTAVVVVQETSPCIAPLPPEAAGGFGVGKYILGATIVGGVVTAAVLIGGGSNDGNEHKAKHRGRSDEPASP